MRGKINTEIVITVLRGKEDPFEVTIIRDRIKIQSVRSRKEGNAAYLRITSFNEKTQSGLLKEMKKLKEELGNNISGIVLDLRNNPGGLLSQAVKISDFFLNNGEIVSTKSRKSSENRKYFAKKGDIINGETLIVLINYGSASASEIVAGALKEHKRAIVIGESSYGKGSVQSIIPLKNKGAIRLTISKYYLPSGKSISGTGIVPDIEVLESTDDFRINTKTDNQLDFAIKLLNG